MTHLGKHSETNNSNFDLKMPEGAGRHGIAGRSGSNSSSLVPVDGSNVTLKPRSATEARTSSSVVTIMSIRTSAILFWPDTQVTITPGFVERLAWMLSRSDWWLKPAVKGGCMQIDSTTQTARVRCQYLCDTSQSDRDTE